MNDQPWDNPARSALFTDLYELTMCQAYQIERMEQPAVFELFFRELRGDWNYVVAAGLDDVLSYFETLQFTEGDIDYLRRHGEFADDFLARLEATRFTGEVHAAPEGTLVFPSEPLIQVVAPIFEAQLVETMVLNQLHFQSVAATKAARVVTAAAGRGVVEFGSRRAHAAEAALKVARASYLVGAAGTSNVLAGKLYGIPMFGTMAHSYIQSHEDEFEAFRRFAETYPETTLLVDTYDTLDGVRKVIELARRLGDDFRVQSIRLDSGDLAELARTARDLLDDAGLQRVKIFASSGLDEYSLAELADQDAPIDAYGVGTKLAVSADVPYLDMAYKLVDYGGRPSIKLSSHKVLYPGRKQVFRQAAVGEFTGDVIGRHDEDLGGEPLLQPVMRDGLRLPAGRAALEQSRDHAQQQLRRLPRRLRSHRQCEPPYPVTFSARLESDLVRIREALQP